MRELARYRCFLMVAEKRSFTRAAGALQMSAPALSQSVRALEDQLGTQLFRRTTRSVALTDAGARLAAKLGPLLAELDGVLADVEETSTAVRGTVRLNVPRIATQRWVGPWLAPFAKAHPDVLLDVTVQDSLVDIVAEQYDAGIRLGERLARDMVAIPLGGSLSMAVVATKGYLARHGTPKTPHELTAHRCINLVWPTHGTTYRWEFTKKGRALEVAVPGSLRVTDGDLALRAAQDGAGIAYVFADAAAPLLHTGKLVRMLEPWTPRFPGLYLYYAKHRRAPAALKAFLDFVRARSKAA